MVFLLHLLSFSSQSLRLAPLLVPFPATTSRLSSSSRPVLTALSSPQDLLLIREGHLHDRNLLPLPQALLSCSVRGGHTACTGSWPCPHQLWPI